MLRTADLMGVLVWGEVPVYWTIQWENPSTLHSAENQLNAMIARDHNRAALIIYSVANETPVSDGPESFFCGNSFRMRIPPTQRAWCRPLSRLTKSRNGHRITIHIDDPIASDLDVLGNNEYIGWYVRRPSDADSIDWVSEYGHTFAAASRPVARSCVSIAFHASAMKPAPFKYIAATSLEHALSLKAEHGDDAKFLAGGQSLIPTMNFRLARPRGLDRHQ